MKAKFIFLIILLVVISYSCGQSAAELQSRKTSDSISEAEKGQAEQDSLAAVAKFINDSLMAIGSPPITIMDLVRPQQAKDVTLNTSTPGDRKIIKTGEIKFRVKDVRSATEKIEDIIIRSKGYVVQSNLSNHIIYESRKNIGKDNYLLSREIKVENTISLRIPKEGLDSFLRALNPLIDLLEFRNYKIDDMTFQYIKNTKHIERITNYGKRQNQHIDTKPSKLKESSVAEGELLDKQLHADELKVENAETEDKIRYCNFQIEIYQRPIIIREVYEDFNDYGTYRPHLFNRIGYSMEEGWWVLEEIIVFLFRLWGILLLLIAVIIFYRFIKKYLKNKKAA